MLHKGGGGDIYLYKEVGGEEEADEENDEKQR
jgi:hypothetical protein